MKASVYLLKHFSSSIKSSLIRRLLKDRKSPLYELGMRMNDDKFMKPQEKIPTVLFFALWIPQAVLRVLRPRIMVVLRCILIFRIIIGRDGGFQEDVEPKAEDEPRENSDQTNDTEMATDMADTGAAESSEPGPDLQMV
jgi:hypothetical protein